MAPTYPLISTDDHVQEPPDLWSSRLSKSRFGDRIPRLQRTARGPERWVVDGQVLLGGYAARAGALMADRNTEPARWDEVPPAAYAPSERLKVMDAAGVAPAMPSTFSYFWRFPRCRPTC